MLKAGNPSRSVNTEGTSALPWLLVLAGLSVMYVPTFTNLFRTIWATAEQGHGPIVLGLGIWLLYRLWPSIFKDNFKRQPFFAWPIISFGLTLYVIGRSQDLLILDVGSLIFCLIGILLLLRGFNALKTAWFPLFFLCFMIPLPGVVVDALTLPMKVAVSHAVENLLYYVGYPIARSGVVLQIGPYALLVADACAGLHTLFTLEAVGLLYLNIVKCDSTIRNTALAILIIPISFFANVLRVIAITLVTYYFGNDAGQGFIHGFAGLFLFAVALCTIFAVDTLLQMLLGTNNKSSISSDKPIPN